MERKIKDKTAVITGGAGGLGFEIADQFLKNEAKHVIILDINESAGEVAVSTLKQKHGEKAEFIKCDVTKDFDRISESIFNKHKTVDVLVNSAGIVNEFDVEKTMSVNTIALMEWSFKFWEHMRKDCGGKGGTIINLSSIYGYRVDPYVPVYKASKFAVMGFTKTLGHEDNFNRTGVRVVAMCPGITKTSLAEGNQTRDPAIQQAQDKFVMEELQWQTADVVGAAAVEVFKRADSGTAWLIEGGRPVEKLP